MEQTKEKLCTTCGRNLLGADGDVTFDCPRCGETEFIRCRSCRALKNKYECDECGFEGP